jgi:PAS domain S-box-containing protein
MPGHDTTIEQADTLMEQPRRRGAVDFLERPFLRQHGGDDAALGTDSEVLREEFLLKAGALQDVIFNSDNFSSIATDERGVIQLFNVGAARMLGYAAAEVVNKITPADISDPQEVIARAKALSQELETTIAPGFEALVFKASRGMEDVYELTYIRKDGSRFPAIVSVTALRDGQGGIIGYLLIGTDYTARKRTEEALLKAGALQNAFFNSANFSCIATDERGGIQLFNVGAERMLGYTAAEVMNNVTPAEISNPREVIARAKTLSLEFGTTVAPGFEALVYKASRGIEDVYELTYIRKDGSRFPAIVSVSALRGDQGGIIGYLLIGTDNAARKQAETEQNKLGQRPRDQQFYTRSLTEPNIDALVATDPLGGEVRDKVRREAPAGAVRRTLLYVEDNPANLKLVEELIALFPDIELLAAVNGTLGIELARAAQPQVILMDINLPGISGIKTLKIMREDAKTAHIPVIALSANAVPGNIAESLGAGFFRYLTKPIKIKDLIDTLDAALEFADKRFPGAQNARQMP